MPQHQLGNNGLILHQVLEAWFHLQNEWETYANPHCHPCNKFSATCAYLLFFAGRCDVKLVQRNKEAFKEAQQENKIHTIMKLQRKSQLKIYYIRDHPYLFLELTVCFLDNICRKICEYTKMYFCTKWRPLFQYTSIPVNQGHQHPDSVYWGACWQNSAATVKRNNLTYFNA